LIKASRLLVGSVVKAWFNPGDTVIPLAEFLQGDLVSLRAVSLPGPSKFASIIPFNRMRPTDRQNRKTIQDWVANLKEAHPEWDISRCYQEAVEMLSRRS